MAHEIEMIDGQAAMAFTGSRNKIWHGLGSEVSNDISSDDMLKAAKLDWSVSKVPLFGEIMKDDQLVRVPTSKMALIRDTDSQVLDVVSNSWHPTQNQEAFDFFKQYVDEGSMEMSTAGSLSNGQIVWALAKIKDSIKVFGDDVIESYLLFTNPHKFGKAVNVRLVMERVVCSNTLSIAMNEKSSREYSQTHKTAFDSQSAAQTLDMVHRQLENFEQQANQIGSKKYNDQQALDYFNKLFPVYNNGKYERKKEVSKMAQLCLDNVKVQPGAEIQQGTYWQLFNSVTNVIDFKTGDDRDKQLVSAWYGSGANKKQEALKMALAA